MAFGTRGDVQPLAVLARAMALACADVDVHFCSNAAHKVTYKDALEDEGVATTWVSTPPVASRELGSPPTSTDDEVKNESTAGGWGLELEKLHQEQCKDCFDEALGQYRPGDLTLVVFNLFALPLGDDRRLLMTEDDVFKQEAWHLSEYFGFRCAAAAPYFIPYCAPASLENQFHDLHPDLLRALKQAAPHKLGWPEVEHWLWPLFSERWSAWRKDRLKLSCCSLTDPVTELPVLYNWPAAPLLLYGVSPIVVERPEYWPKSVHLCGFWSDKEHVFDTKRSYDGRRHQYVPPPKLQQYLEGSRAGSDPPIVVSFSSMGSMGLIHNAGLLLQILVATIRRTGHRAILLTSNHTPLEDAIAAMEVRPSIKSCKNMPIELEEGLQLVDGQLFCIARPIPHNWLFQRCGLVVHHAGSGTTAAALGAGISQVPCPFIFDQFYWAERMAWLGVASKPVALHNILSGRGTLEPLVEGTDALTGAILQAAAPTMRQRARDVASNLGKEDGVGAAVSLLHLELDTHGAGPLQT
eukprot:SM000275S10314  [mRNA]  locus=s275:27872:32150:+ [translate_table: standard]